MTCHLNVTPLPTAGKTSVADAVAERSLDIPLHGVRSSLSQCRSVSLSASTIG